MVIFQTYHAIVWYIIPITHHCAVMFSPISTFISNCRRAWFLCHWQDACCKFAVLNPDTWFACSCFAARQTWDTSSLDCSEFIHFLFYSPRPWHTLQLWKFLSLSVMKRDRWERFGDERRDNLNFSLLLFPNHWHCDILESKQPFRSVTKKYKYHLNEGPLWTRLVM